MLKAKEQGLIIMSKFHKFPAPRHQLPTRRLAENRQFTTPEGHTVHLSVGYDPDEQDRPREVFYSGGFRSGSQLEFQVQDSCILFSLLLQYGLRPDEISKSLSRVELPDGSNACASLIGRIAEELVAQ
ncbi:hypothetical protein [uncultured Ruegeria sp.]|uniref:TSCPD domain-containing protein n=1 Tax=uncultured Ruegeria sp. TaxID=259304 RepID=UPI002627FF3D|nr:hypothetical protein [uncultured Ruegeria sp.]